ncbi:unnamed protein product, partial [Rotaria sp. Silwood2]
MYCLAKGLEIRIHSQKNEASGRLAARINRATNPILYHKGPVMINSTAYVIWYGNWAGNTGVALIEYFLQNIGTHPWWYMTTEYNQTAGIVFGKSTTDNYSQGKTLTDARVLTIVKSAIISGRLPNDTNGIYFVLTAGDVSETSGFCTQYCGWHSYDPASKLKFSFVGNPATKCPKGCSPQPLSPNNNLGADAMISVIAHEATEAVTDPALNAWYDASGQENADKCAWTFGNTSTASNGA